MKTGNSIVVCGYVALLTLGLSSAANAQATRTWVSGVGDDVNPCSRTAPCKTFAGAISKTAANGEINCLDPGGFGAVTITKAITIDCGFTGGILASGTNGIVISAGGSDLVTIRNLEINGSGGAGADGVRGISFLNGQGLLVEHVTISNFTTAGISVTAAGSKVVLSNVTISRAGTGILVNPTGGGVSQVDIGNTRIFNNANGVQAFGPATNVSIHDATLVLNLFGIVQSGGVGSGTMLVRDSQFTANTTAVQANTASNISVFGNTFAQNGLVLNPNGGAIFTDGGNRVAPGNGPTGVANGGVVPKM